MARQPRQRPISCKLCRQRKLRCSRVFPCSNCVCRGLECVHDGPTSAATAPSSAISPGAAGGGGGANANAAAASQDKTAQLPKELPASELLARLEKLEALVANQSRDVPAVPPVVPPPPPISQPQRPLPAFPGNTPNLTSHTTATTSSPISPQIQRLTDDALWLERSCSGNSLVESLVSDPITFRACPVRRITKQPSFIFQSDPSSAQLGIADVIKCIWLPRRDEARIILDKYISDVDHFHHVIHIPTLRKLLETTYDTIESTATPDIGAVILILSVCATCTYSWSLEDDARQLYADVGEARAQATAWIKATLDVIDHAHRTVSSSMECIQGMIILFFVFCNLEGLSHRSRSLISKSIAMSREMGLHRIDSQVSLPETANMCTLRAEIGRRIWWCLVGTDWMMAQFAAPQESTYTIHPGHMAVRKPTNLNDEDVVEGKALIGRPLNYPTRVSALIFRLRLAELCQSLLEKNPSLAMNPDSLPYANVIEIDGKLRSFLQDLPDFFCLDNVTLRSLPPQDPRRAHHIVVQRYTLNLMLHRHLCKLHLPYLARGTVDATFSYSRNACLMSARMIIHAEKMLKMEGLPFSTTRLRSIMVIRSVFLASIVLVLNACLSNDVNGNDADTEHLIESWRILDEAKGQSVTAAKLLELSVQVLRRHAPNHVALSNLPQMASEPMPMTPESAPHDEQRKMMPQMELRPELDPTYIEQQWQALEGRMDLNTIDWDKLFYGLDAPFI